VPQGGTALFDAVTIALPRAQNGRHRKKALLIISDGNDTASQSSLRELREQIRESEVLVYAIGIDGEYSPGFGAPPPRAPMPPFRRPFPPTGGRRGWPSLESRVPSLSPQIGIPRQPQQPRFPRQVPGDDRVNAGVLRELTDDSGGRTEIIRSARDLDPATAGIADELSRQYFMGYEADGKKDGRYHRIRVEAHDTSFEVRARRGYVAN
jgi:VWFA-related protein